uniref:Uncharacterized protein n=1 Tax=Rousettus aegyptiacus TaxID=9407 RepID=A0A7J8HSI3_ROUAE|nr:hypothetical protein HJG63_011131 [Rousettus aegyptiacus]
MHHLYTALCLPPKVKSLSIAIYLAPFTLTYLCPPLFPLVPTNPQSMFMSLSLSHSFVAFGFTPHMSEIYHTVLNFFQLISLSMIISKSIHVVTNGSISSLHTANIPLCIYTTASLPSHLSKDTSVIQCLGHCE